jgi:hypothetical protein
MPANWERGSMQQGRKNRMTLAKSKSDTNRERGPIQHVKVAVIRCQSGSEFEWSLDRDRRESKETHEREEWRGRFENTFPIEIRIVSRLSYHITPLNLRVTFLLVSEVINMQSRVFRSSRRSSAIEKIGSADRMARMHQERPASLDVRSRKANSRSVTATTSI